MGSVAFRASGSHFHRVSGSGSEVVKSEGVVDNGSVVAVVVNNPGLFFAAGSPAEGSAMSCYAVSIHRQSGRSGTGGKGSERSSVSTPCGTVGSCTGSFHSHSVSGFRSEGIKGEGVGISHYFLLIYEENPTVFRICGIVVCPTDGSTVWVNAFNIHSHFSRRETGGIE